MKPVCRAVIVHRELKVALCQGFCGLRPVALLTPDDNDPPGLRDLCNGQTCDCDGCLFDEATLEALVRN